MITQSRSPRLRAANRVSGSSHNRSPGSGHTSRLIQVALALYLLPALLIVLVVGSLGMLILTANQLFVSLNHKSVG
jgi:hypothetical protein